MSGQAPRPATHLAADVEHDGLVLDVPELLDGLDEPVAQLRERHARLVPQHGIVLKDEHRLCRVIAPGALLPQRHMRAGAAALALGHLVHRRHRLLVVQAVEARMPLARHEGIAHLVPGLGGEAAALEALRAHLALDELAAVLTLRQVDVHRVHLRQIVQVLRFHLHRRAAPALAAPLAHAGEADALRDCGRAGGRGR